jgi:hypothetical protein
MSAPFVPTNFWVRRRLFSKNSWMASGTISVPAPHIRCSEVCCRFGVLWPSSPEDRNDEPGAQSAWTGRARAILISVWGWSICLRMGRIGGRSATKSSTSSRWPTVWVCGQWCIPPHPVGGYSQNSRL